MQPYNEPAAEVAMEAAPVPRAMQSFGQLPLRSSAPMQRWREQGEETLRRQKEAHAEMKRREAATTRAAMQNSRDWNKWADRKIADALEAHVFNNFSATSSPW